MKNNKKSNFKNYKWIVIWGIISILFMMIIHILFHIEGPKWLEAKWTAGEILTYVSTVSLGLLALWQNQKFELEQNKANRKTLAVDKYPLFIIESSAAEFYSSDKFKASRHGKFIENGVNGNIALWEFDSYNFEGIDRVRFVFVIKNIGNVPATTLCIMDDVGSACPNCNVLHSDDEINDKSYILNDKKGKIYINSNLEELEKGKEYYLHFANPFGSRYKQKIKISMEDFKVILIDAQCDLDIKEN